MNYASVFKPDLFSGQTIIVTGGGSGIGRCIAHELAALGAKIVLTGRSQEKLDTVQAEIQEDGGQAATKAFDIRNEEAVKQSIAEIVEENGPIHHLVNNAGGQFAVKLENLSLNGWEAVVRNNLTGGFLVSREVLLQSMKETGGTIVNIVADFWHSMPNMGHSGAARAGMVNFTKTAALEWAHHGVRVNAVAPGIIASSGLDTYGEEHKKSIRERSKKMPTKRLGTEAEVSAAVVFLMTPAAAFITGTTLRVDGGVPNTTINYQIPDHDKLPAFEGFHRAVYSDFLKEVKG
ncbi:SDR family oxidoreductase [Sneathiella chinensis]|uniref:Peroxisomal trans-2-enoyl-CoA reductase n=1 Tax=Sneathiella chinensis TaxID=349750 RepID=A0ABQ5U079_9PROT|nr:SDR family oxidoreductase [Sneathiella chinensis]GLQ05554.1 citronellol catabolism dehydrogenase [Sneathiella chinensis]